MSLISVAPSELKLQSPRSRLPDAGLSILEAWDIAPLSPLAERTLRMLDSMYTHKGFCHATHEQLARSLRTAKSTLQRGVAELEAEGCLVIQRRTGTSNVTRLATGVKEALRVQHLERVLERKKRVKSRLSTSKRGKNRPKAVPTAQPESLPRDRHFSLKSKAASKQHHGANGDALACFSEKQRETIEKLTEIGITRNQAILLVRKYALERIYKHLQAQKYPAAKNPPGYLVSAIRNDYQEIVSVEGGSSQGNCLTNSETCDAMAPTGTEEGASQAECLTASETCDILVFDGIEERRETDTTPVSSQAESLTEPEACDVIQTSPTFVTDAIDRAAAASTMSHVTAPVVAGFVPLGLSPTLAALNARLIAEQQCSNTTAAQASPQEAWCLTEAERDEIDQELLNVVPDTIKHTLVPNTLNLARTPVVVELVALGVQPTIAALTASTYSEERIRRQLKLGKHLTANNPAAFIMAAIRRDYAVDQPMPGSEHEAVFHRERQERLAQKSASAASTIPKKKPSTVPLPPPPSPLDILRMQFHALGEQEQAKFVAAAREDLIKSPPPHIGNLVARGNFESPLLAATLRTRAMKMWESSVSSHHR